MQEAQFTEILLKGCDELGVTLPDSQLPPLYFYFCELKKWSQKINLIGKTASDREIIEVHFLDSLTLLLVLKQEQQTLFDIGSGAGFPGLVCKIARPELDVMLVEPRGKRVSFLKHIIRNLKLNNISAIQNRAEKIGTELGEEKCFVVSRAVTDIALFINMLENFPKETQVVCMKGPRWQEELAEAGVKHGVEINKITVKELSLPECQAKRALVCFCLGDVNTI